MLQHVKSGFFLKARESAAPCDPKCRALTLTKNDSPASVFMLRPRFKVNIQTKTKCLYLRFMLTYICLSFVPRTHILSTLSTITSLFSISLPFRLRRREVLFITAIVWWLNRLRIVECSYIPQKSLIVMSQTLLMELSRNVYKLAKHLKSICPHM